MKSSKPSVLCLFRCWFSRVSGEEHRETGSVTESELQDRSGRVAVQHLGGCVLFQEEAMHFVPEKFKLTQKRKT